VTRASSSDTVARVLGIEPQELARTLLMAGALFLLIALQTTIKVVRDAAFLSRFEVADLSYVMLAIAFATGGALKFYNRLTACRTRNTVIWVLNLVVAATLLVFAVALRVGGSRVPVVFYLWTSIASLAVLSEFWLLANDVFHAGQARRLFAVVAAGGVLGGVFGGATSQILSKRIPVSYMLVLAAGELAVAALLCDLAWRRAAERPLVAKAASSRVTDLLPILRQNAYARWIVAVIVSMTIATTLTDWQFKAYAKLHFASHEVEMARFFAIVALVLGTLSFILQLLGTRRLLRWVGASGCMRALPVSCSIGAAFVLGTLVLPVAPLIAATAGNLLVNGVQFSVDRCATELLFTPLPDETRSVFKRFVDTALDRFAGGLAALIWLGLVYAVRVNRPDRLVYASLATLVVVCFWLFSVSRLRSGYIDAFRELIGAPVGQVAATSPPRQVRRVERLLGALGSNAAARHRALRALTSIQSSTPSLALDPALVDPHVVVELDDVELLQRVAASISEWGRPRLRILEREIQASIKRGVERIVRLLALVYPPSDITSLHRALRRHTTRQRAAALEFLEALVDMPVKRRLVHALENVVLPRYHFEPVSRLEGLQALLHINNARLRAFTAWSAGSSGLLLDEVRRLSVSDPSRGVRATALLTLTTRRGRRAVPPSAPTKPATILAGDQNAP
jgi:AAA family ATP:ADP antiporter